jgi:hypothetical protein
VFVKHQWNCFLVSGATLFLPNGLRSAVDAALTDDDRLSVEAADDLLVVVDHVRNREPAQR